MKRRWWIPVLRLGLAVASFTTTLAIALAANPPRPENEWQLIMSRSGNGQQNEWQHVHLASSKGLNKAIDRERAEYVDGLINMMTLEEKVGQLFIWRAQGTEMTEEFAAQLVATRPGGVILMGGNISPALHRFVADIQSLNRGIPMFIAIDQEGGEVRRILSDPNPGAPALSKLSEDEMCGFITGTSTLLESEGVNLNFGIVGDVAYSDKSFMRGRAFGNDPLTVSSKVALAVRCSTLLRAVKHFPGHGRTSEDSHHTIPEIKVSYSEWQRSDMLPFAEAINQNVDFVMVGHLKYSGFGGDIPASLDPIMISELRKMGFEGVVITDDMGMLTESGIDEFVAMEQAVRAGEDMLLYVKTTASPRELVGRLTEKVRSGEIPESRIDESVRRILIRKYSLIR